MDSDDETVARNIIEGESDMTETEVVYMGRFQGNKNYDREKSGSVRYVKKGDKLGVPDKDIGERKGTVRH